MGQLQIIFELRDGRLEPCPPRDVRGDAIEPDGKTFLSLAQAVTLTGRSEQALRDEWLALWKRTIPDPNQPFADGGKVFSPEPVAGSTEGAATSSVPNVTRLSQADVDILRAVRFPELSDDQVQFLAELCQRRNLNIWWNHLYADLVHDERTQLPRLIPVLMIDGMRLIAQRSGEYAGCDAFNFTYGDEDQRTEKGKRIPLSASATVYRMLAGERVPFTREVFWEEYYPVGGDSLYDEMPRVCLGRCAMAAALREAFTAETAGFYTPEEMKQARGREKAANRANRRAPAQASSSGSAGLAYDTDSDDDVQAVTDYEGEITLGLFERTLIEDFGFNSPARRREVTEGFRAKHPAMYASNRAGFYAVVLSTIRENPGLYGASVGEHLVV